MELQKLIKQYQSIRPDFNWQQASKSHLLDEMANVLPVKQPGYFYFKFKPVFATLIVLGVILGGSWGTLYAAKNSLPGQPLYSIKRLAEKAHLAVVFNQTDKNVLRANLLNTRIQEAQVFAQRVRDGSDSQAEEKLISMSNDIKSDIDFLQKEIISQSETESASEMTFDEGSLPIQDGKKMAEIIFSEDLKKSLAETKESLVKDDLSTALAKTIKVNKQLTTVEATSTPAAVEPVSTVEEPIPSEPKVILKKAPGSVGALPKQIKQAEDFKISPIRESEIKTGLIRE